MKTQDIKVGGIYTDGKLGLRRVTAAGAEYRLYDGQEETDCLQYELLTSTAGFRSVAQRGTSATGNPLAHSTRQSFAAWAKAEVPADQLEQKVAAISARRVKLTPPQTKFMRTFDPPEELRTGGSWSCDPEELRVARACQEKGLLTIGGEPGPGHHFEVKLTPLGIEVALFAMTNSAVAA